MNEVKLAAAQGSAARPAMTDYEAKVFRRFARRHTPGYWDHSLQLEGDKQLPVVAAAFRLMRKGILCRPRACAWFLTDLGREMAVEWQRQNAVVSQPGQNLPPSSTPRENP